MYIILFCFYSRPLDFLARWNNLMNRWWPGPNYLQTSTLIRISKAVNAFGFIFFSMWYICPGITFMEALCLTLQVLGMKKTCSCLKNQYVHSVFGAKAWGVQRLRFSLDNYFHLIWSGLYFVFVVIRVTIVAVWIRNHYTYFPYLHISLIYKIGHMFAKYGHHEHQCATVVSMIEFNVFKVNLKSQFALYKLK